MIVHRPVLHAPYVNIPSIVMMCDQAGKGGKKKGLAARREREQRNRIRRREHGCFWTVVNIELWVIWTW